MKHRKYCYHITDGIRRSALSCGTVTASSMENAAILAATRAGLTVAMVDRYGDGEEFPEWQDTQGKKRNVYVLHDPKP